MTILAGNSIGSGGTYGRNAGQSRVSRFSVATAGTADTISANVNSSPSDVALVVYSASGVNNNATTLLGYGVVPAGQTGLVSVALNQTIELTQGQLIWLGLSESGFLLGDDNNQISMQNGVDPEDGTPESAFSVFSSQNYRAPVIYLEQTQATGASVTAADVTDESQPATFTLSGNENAPTGITINGEAGSNITFVSEDTGAGTETYSYEPPLIADDGTADLVVSVDGTTAGATIAYANSYDRDQLTHPAESKDYHENSLSYPNAYATTQPYEWKVIADANASVVTINWDVLEVDDGFHKDVASYATPMANGSTTVTLGVFVPETGQAYQFDRTITVSDGSVVVTGEGLWRELFRDPTEDLFTELFR